MKPVRNVLEPTRGVIEEIFGILPAKIQNFNFLRLTEYKKNMNALKQEDFFKKVKDYFQKLKENRTTDNGYLHYLSRIQI